MDGSQKNCWLSNTLDGVVAPTLEETNWNKKKKLSRNSSADHLREVFFPSQTGLKLSARKTARYSLRHLLPVCVCAFVFVFRPAMSLPPTWWICCGNSPAHGPCLHVRLSAWWPSFTASSVPYRPSLSKAPVRQSWSCVHAFLMPGVYCISFGTTVWLFGVG